MSSDVLDLKFKQGDLLRKANEENVKARRGLESQISNLSYVIEDSRKSIGNAENVVGFDKNKVAEYQKMLDDSRTEWKAEKERTFDESSLICPYCKQEYPEDKKEELRADFKAHKKMNLTELLIRATQLRKCLMKLKRH